MLIAYDQRCLLGDSARKVCGGNSVVVPAGNDANTVIGDTVDNAVF